jgi:hypothetical protein
MDHESNKPVPSATVSIIAMDTVEFTKTTITAKDGSFMFEQLPHRYYRLKFTATGYAPLTIDSIHIRKERFDFDLNEVKISRQATALQEVIIYAEKPLIENKDGKIIFNAGESALSAGATGTELLKQTPLVNIDPDGKVMLKGKDAKILIDDKPVELNARQLQDLLESLPGSMIDKIEVMTTPPPQYANERGGVINIVTKKGRVGMNARLNVSYGTRGESGINGHFSYRKNKFSLNVNAGFGYNEYQGNSNSARQNIYRDSTNFFNTTAVNSNLNRRPNGRLNIDYDFNKRNSLGFTVNVNSNNASSDNNTEYINLNRFNEVWRRSNRFVDNDNTSINPHSNITYTYKGKDPSEVLKLIGGYNYHGASVHRNFFQQFVNPATGQPLSDSNQLQKTNVKAHTYSLRINYDKPLKKEKWFLNTGGFVTRFRSHNTLHTEFLKKPDMIFIDNPLLSNDFVFYQNVLSARFAIRYTIKKDFNITAGVQQEYTTTDFAIKNNSNDFRNDYWSSLPFLTLVKKWENDINLNFSYKHTIQRPGLNEMNPSVDYSDPYNIRFGNPYLAPYYADNYDLAAGKWNKLYNINFSVGYNKLSKIYSLLRSLTPDGKTEVTWENISGREEYEASAWGGYTISKKSKANLSIGYTYNVYSLHDRLVRKFRNGGSLYSTLNSSYQFSDVLNASGSFTYNRFANPQGTVRNALSMNVGVQQKFFKKKLNVSLNVIDPFTQQENRTFTYGSNFNLESYSTTRTRNFRIAVGYIFSKKVKKSQASNKSRK